MPDQALRWTGGPPIYFYFPEEFIGGYWPWNSFAGLMFWVEACGKSLAGVT